MSCNRARNPNTLVAPAVKPTSESASGTTLLIAVFLLMSFCTMAHALSQHVRATVPGVPEVIFKYMLYALNTIRGVASAAELVYLR